MEKSIPRLSVIVPCYNAEKTVGICLSSLLAQTMQEVEVVCVDDGSQDDTLAVLTEAAHRTDGRIRVVSQPNLGTWAARRRGIAEATGEFIGFVDADDTVEPSFARTLYDAAKASSADIVICGYQRVEQHTGRILAQELCQEEPPFVMWDDPGCILGINTAVWNKAYRASVLKSLPHLSHVPKALEDVCINLLAYLGTAGPIVRAPKPLVNYMVHENSTVTSVTPEVLQQDKAALLDVRQAYVDAKADVRYLAALDAAAFEHLGISMAFRLSGSQNVNLTSYLNATSAYLDANFPTWRRSPYMRTGYARTHNAAIKRLTLAHRLYLSHMMQPSLSIYQALISRLGVDVKW